MHSAYPFNLVLLPWMVQPVLSLTHISENADILRAREPLNHSRHPKGGLIGDNRSRSVIAPEFRGMQMKVSNDLLYEIDSWWRNHPLIYQEPEVRLKSLVTNDRVH